MTKLRGADSRQVLEALKVAVAITDAKGAIAFANLAFAGMCGKEAREVAGSALASLFAKEDRKRIEQNIARVGEGKAGSAILEAKMPSAGGERWVQVLMQAHDAREKANGVIAIVHDIDAQRDTEQALYVLTARLLALAEASPVAALIESADGDVDMVNEAFIRLVGLEGAPQSFMGLPADEVFARATSLDRKSLERQPIVVEGRIAGAIWSPKKSGDEGTKGAAEIALIEKIGEELSAALEGLSAIATRARQMEVDPVLVDHFLRIRRATEAALAAIGELVDFTNISGHIVLRKSDFSLRAELASLLGRMVESAEEHDCRLRLKVEQDVADALEGDAERLFLVLKNLLDSAFALLPGAEITLQITPEYVTEAGIQLSFSVVHSDEGPDRHAIATPGAGMGVALAKFMVAAMGGKVAITPHPMVGDAIYSFTIEFPVRPAQAAAPRPTYPSIGGLTAMVVSGNPEQRLGLSNLLRGWRMIPLEADNAPMALALLERMQGEGNPIPLVIVTNRLAGQDGFLLAFRIRNHAKLKATLVMMLATEGKPGDAIACRENGISAYMRYPINERQLYQAILTVTGASKGLDAETTATLVTRHSLRESRKGATVLLVDPGRDSQLLAAHFLGREDCSVVVAGDLDEALSALEQDVYDVVLVDTSLAGLQGDDAAQLLRARIRDPEATRIVALTDRHTKAFDKAKLAIGFDATLAKPFRKDDLHSVVETVVRAPASA
jgi:PAS domain S-box-containing protein